MDFRIIIAGGRQLLLDRTDHEVGWEVLLSTYTEDDDRYMESHLVTTIWEAREFIAHFSEAEAAAYFARSQTTTTKNFYRPYPCPKDQPEHQP